MCIRDSILHNIPIIIRDEELIVGSNSIAPRGCQTFPEFSFQWLEDELDTVATRTADPFYISEQAKADLREAHKYLSLIHISWNVMKPWFQSALRTVWDHMITRWFPV